MNYVERVSQYIEHRTLQIEQFFKQVLYLDDKSANEGFDRCYLDQFNRRLGIHPISQFLPQRFYHPETELYTTSKGKGFAWKAVPLVGVEEDSIKSLHELFQLALPVGACGQVLLQASPKVGPLFDDYMTERQDASPLFQKLAHYRAAFAKKAALNHVLGEPFLLRDYRLYISVHLDDKLGLSLDELKGIKSRVFSLLRTVHLQPQALSPSELINLAGELLRPNDSVYDQGARWDPVRPLNTQVVDPYYLRKPTSRRVGSPNTDWEIITFSVSDYPTPAPRLWDMGQMIGGLFNQSRFECPFNLSFIFRIGDAKKEIKSPAMQTHNAETRAREQRGRSQDANRDNCAWVEINNQIQAEQKLINSHFQIQLHTQRGKRDDNIARMKDIVCSKMDWRVERNDLVHLATLLCHLPLSQSAGVFKDLDALGVTRKLWSMNAANLMPVLAEMKGSHSKKAFLVGRRGQVAFTDPFAHNRGNYNMAITGGSGSGKSVFTQDNICAQLATGARVVVVDVGRSYFKLSRLLDGTFVVFSKGENLQINPFWTKNRGNMDADDTDAFLKFIGAFIFYMAYPDSDGEYLDRAWQKSTINTTVRHLWNEFLDKPRCPMIQDVIDRLTTHSDQRARDIAVQLESFGVDGHNGKYFNGEGGLDFDDQFMIFELEEITNDTHLRSLIFMLLIQNITEKMYLSDRSQRRVLIIDEAWDLLKGGAGGDMIESVARRARKYLGSLWTITQGSGDFDQSAASRAAWENSYWKCFLSQDSSSIATAISKGLLTPTPVQERLMKSIHTEQGVYSEVMLCGNRGEYMAGRFMLDPFSNALYSTQGEEFNQFNRLRERGLSVEDALTEIAVQNYGLEREFA